jgi:hypothetical protein
MGQVKKQKGQAKAAMGHRAAPVLQEHEKTMAAIKESGILSALQRKKQVYANQYIMSQHVPGYVPDYYIVTHCCRSRICSYIQRWSFNAFMIAFVLWLIKQTVDMMLADFVGGWSWLGTIRTSFGTIFMVMIFAMFARMGMRTYESYRDGVSYLETTKSVWSRAKMRDRALEMEPMEIEPPGSPWA